MKRLLCLLLLISTSSWASGLADYSTTAGNNTFLFPEPMPAGDVNDAARQLMADVRSFYEEPQWIDLGFDPTRLSDNSFTVSGNKTSYFPVGRRIRMSDVSTLYGTISASSYSSPLTTVTVKMDSGTLTSDLAAVAVGLVDGQSSPIPQSAIYGLTVDRITSSSTNILSSPAALGFTVSGTQIASLTTTGLTVAGSVSMSDGSYFSSSGGTMKNQSQGNRYDNVDGGDWYLGNPAARMNLLAAGTDVAGAAGVVGVSGTISATAVKVGGYPIGMVLLDSKTASSSASLIFSGFSSDYDEYVFVLNGLQPATNNVALYVTASTDGGSTYLAGTNYKQYISNLGGSNATGDSVAQISLSPQNQSNGTTAHNSGELRLFSPLSAATYKGMTYTGMYANQADGVFSPAIGLGVVKTSSALTNVKFAYSSGNISVGTIRMYGMRNH